MTGTGKKECPGGESSVPSCDTPGPGGEESELIQLMDSITSPPSPGVLLRFWNMSERVQAKTIGLLSPLEKIRWIVADRYGLHPSSIAFRERQSSVERVRIARRTMLFLATQTQATLEEIYWKLDSNSREMSTALALVALQASTNQTYRIVLERLWTTILSTSDEEAAGEKKDDNLL